MDIQDTQDPTPNASSTPARRFDLSSILAPILASRYGLPSAVGAAALVVGIILGAAMAAAYTLPLQAEQARLQEQARYERVMTVGLPIIATGYDQLRTDSIINNVPAEKADATALSNAAQDYITDLKKLTVPACLQATNTAFIQGLTNIQQDAGAIDQALVAHDNHQATAAVLQVVQGVSQVDKATADYAAAAC